MFAMSELETEDDEFVEYYRNAKLSDDKVDVILSSVDAIRSARRWRRLAIAASIAFAMMTGLSAFQYLDSRIEDEKIAVQRDGKVDDDAPPAKVSDPSLDQESPDSAAMPRYRFVAFRSHDDRCPRCRATGEMFAKLRGQLEGEAIDFEQFELQKDQGRTETFQRIDELMLTSSVAGRDETAFGILLSPAGNEIRRLDPMSDMMAIEQRVREVIDQ